MLWLALCGSQESSKGELEMLSLVKDFFSSAVRSRLRARLPSFLFRKSSYSQCGEDLLVTFLLDLVCGNRPKRYLDIGANHPFHLSNTALLYAKGGHGVLVEPDPNLAGLLQRKRSRDTVLQKGVHFSGEARADFYVMTPPTLNTFSSDEMQRCIAMGHELVQTIPVELVNINTILGMAGKLDFMNLDIEGMDLAILEMIDWNEHRPTCICVETLKYDTQQEPKKILEIIDFVCSQGYDLYADTFINSIFVDKNKWQAHWQK